MTMPMKMKIARLQKLSEDAVNLEWGSEDQINAENQFFSLSKTWFGIDWQNHKYLDPRYGKEVDVANYFLKATTPEMITYAWKVIYGVLEGIKR